MVIMLPEQSFVTLIKIKAGINILKGHYDVRNHFIIKPCTLKCDMCDTFYAKILSNKVFFTYHYNYILIFISSA